MGVVTVSPRYEVVIPEDVRYSMGIRPGQKVCVFGYGDRIELIPVRAMHELRGFLKAIDTTVPRHEKRS